MKAAHPVVLITGAAGQLGTAVAAYFAQQGARLLLLDRDAKALQAHAGALGDAA